jgi:hypothetical protein
MYTIRCVIMTASYAATAVPLAVLKNCKEFVYALYCH